MKNLFLLIIALFFLINCNVAKGNDEVAVVSKYTITFEPGLLLGNPQTNYPSPFSSHASILLNNQKSTLYFGLGTGAEIIGKTFLPVFADVRVLPLKGKPIFFYGKAGWSFCSNNIELGTNSNPSVYYYNYLPMPHYPNQTIETRGGLLSEAGFGIIMERGDWKTSMSLGFRHQQTKDIAEQSNNTKKTFENRFNRIAFRLGFWF